MSLLETVKDHPAMALAIVVIVGGGTLWLMSSSGSSQTVSPAPTSGYDGSGTAFQDQLNASMQGAQLAAQLQSSAAHDANALEMAKLSLQAFNANEQTKQFQISNDTAVQMQASTLNAAVQQATIDSTIRRDQIASATQVSLAASQAETNKFLVSTLASVTNNQTAATQAIATQSWWDKTFG